ncbi:hypothetical protein FTV88_2204 [Heliorestis convoluta]|uniref:Uncharacterized protein n=1 Tax=Heliorestis convoluta TaxID=356322 RepID=A0A5Q2N4R3_9FIRM|nr:hypothetical protein FTV88_2204 [Heliorestis convoluta]
MAVEFGLNGLSLFQELKLLSPSSFLFNYFKIKDKKHTDKYKKIMLLF